MMKKTITYGTFDLFHKGHVNLLRRVSELGDHLTVAVSTDEFNKEKGKTCLHPYDDRVAVIESICYVDKVISEGSWEQKVTDVQKYDIDIFAIGDDWANKFDFLREYCEVVYLPRTPDISTTMIKECCNMKLDKLSKE